jgi:hypothetical protein
VTETVLIRATAEDRQVLRELAALEQRPMRPILSDAIEFYRRYQFLKMTNDAYAKLKADPMAWGDYQRIQKELEGTLMDGLEDEDFSAWRKPDPQDTAQQLISMIKGLQKLWPNWEYED